MTYIYEYGNDMPDTVDITCPTCGKKAIFHFAKKMRITDKKHIPAFESSPYFAYDFQQNDCYWKHYAIFQPAFFGKLDEEKIDSLGEIASLYKAASIYRCYNFGAYVCNHCLSRATHSLDWENDAYYQTNIRGHKLWAFNKDHLIAMRDFIQSDEREEKNHDYALALYHLPTVFKTKKMREDVLKGISRMSPKLR